MTIRLSMLLGAWMLWGGAIVGVAGLQLGDKPTGNPEVDRHKIAALEVALRDASADPDRRNRALISLPNFGADAVPALLKQVERELDGDDPAFLREVVRALTSVPDRRSIAALAGIALSDDPRVGVELERMAVEALGAFAYYSRIAIGSPATAEAAPRAHETLVGTSRDEEGRLPIAIELEAPEIPAVLSGIAAVGELLDETDIDRVVEILETVQGESLEAASAATKSLKLLEATPRRAEPRGR